MLTRAGERAASLAANEEAEHCFERAAGLSDDTLDEAKLRERAGATAWSAGRAEQAQRHLERALELYEGAGMTHPAARVSARLGEVEWRAGHLEQALERMERAFAVLSDDEPDEDLAVLAAELGRLHFFRGEVELAARRVETAVEIAESLWLPEVLSQALNTQGLIASFNGRSEQSLALVKHALELALEHDLTLAALRAYNNLGDQLDRRDRYDEAIEFHRRGLALARKAGDRLMEWRLLGELSWCLMRTGQWTESLELATSVPEDQAIQALAMMNALVEIPIARGETAEARRALSLIARFEDSADVQDRSLYATLSAAVLRAEGRFEEALAACEDVFAASQLLGSGPDIKIAFAEGLEAALALGRLDFADELLDRIDDIPPGKRPPFLWAHSVRFHARLAALRGEDDAVEQGFKTAEAVLREHKLVFDLAVVQLEHGEWLAGQGRAEEAEPLLSEAREIFERLEAAPWLERVDVALPAPVRIGSEGN
jgi:tetratricopeptide (TPR) repeat protein